MPSNWAAFAQRSRTKTAQSILIVAALFNKFMRISEKQHRALMV